MVRLWEQGLAGLLMQKGVMNKLGRCEELSA